MYEKTRIQKQSTLLHAASRRKTHRLASDYYAYLDESVYAFFMVKNYEDSLKVSTKLEAGTAVKVDGKVIQTRTEESFYGVMTINTILTDNGTECERVGVIPTTGSADFYGW